MCPSRRHHLRPSLRRRGSRPLLEVLQARQRADPAARLSVLEVCMAQSIRDVDVAVLRECVDEVVWDEWRGDVDIDGENGDEGEAVNGP